MTLLMGTDTHESDRPRPARSGRLGRVVTASIAAVVLATGLVGGATAAGSDVQAAKVATARFHSTVQAGRAGYGPFPAGVPLHECIASTNGTGAMGVHWVNGQLLDATLDPTRPEVLVYEPGPDGELNLVAVEYVIFQADWFEHHAANTMPMLFGQPFMEGDHVRFQIPPFFALHAWLHKSNPSGMFASYNPNVSCGGASAAAGAGAANLAVARTTELLCTIPRIRA
jgi:hypothetical protein